MPGWATAPAPVTVTPIKGWDTAPTPTPKPPPIQGWIKFIASMLVSFGGSGRLWGSGLDGLSAWWIIIPGAPVYGLDGGPVALSGSGTLSVTVDGLTATMVFGGYSIIVPVTAFTGSGALSATMINGFAANFVGGGALSATVKPIVPVPAALSGAGTLSGAVQRVAVTANFSGGGALSATVVIPPSFDSIGAGYKPPASGVGSPNAENHTLVATADVFAFVGFGNTAPPGLAVTCGGVAMTQISSQPTNNVGPAAVTVWRLSGVAAGTKSISASWTGGGALFLGIASVAYRNVNSVSTPTKVFGSGTALSSGALTCPANSILVSALDQSSGGSVSLTPSGGTNRFNLGGGQVGLVVSDATADTTFTASSGFTNPWAGISFVLS